jgi:hypothetical protein
MQASQFMFAQGTTSGEDIERYEVIDGVRVERSSSWHWCNVTPKAPTPWHAGILPLKDPSSSLSYSACAIAWSTYSVRMYVVDIAPSLLHNHEA